MSNETLRAILHNVRKASESATEISKELALIKADLKQRERERFIIACVSIAMSFLAVSISLAVIFRKT